MNAVLLSFRPCNVLLMCFLGNRCDDPPSTYKAPLSSAWLWLPNCICSRSRNLSFMPWHCQPKIPTSGGVFDDAYRILHMLIMPRSLFCIPADSWTTLCEDRDCISSDPNYFGESRKYFCFQKLFSIYQETTSQELMFHFSSFDALSPFKNRLLKPTH